MMSTKTNPGKFDCYANAGPNEQLFTLREHDPLAPFLISIWASIRMGDTEAAGVKFNTMIHKVAPRYCAEPDAEKASDALQIAMAMFHAQRAKAQAAS
jgi:hypothetical protein